ncbi:hypothetical protein EGR_07515 [Echinococcus granulosus]|uniref:Uncharacterized protein n=1 Tax=Echinococcus granulosus TaxID=6210 RepID=W6UVZ4_ECHGR|nr:hypothetical protein EGR_07515 [Echinococcus granulosus]EUB57639.1 hypothetical protein EGR_07515 [Echinococcus granulosus]
MTQFCSAITIFSDFPGQKHTEINQNCWEKTNLKNLNYVIKISFFFPRSEARIEGQQFFLNLSDWWVKWNVKLIILRSLFCIPSNSQKSNYWTKDNYRRNAVYHTFRCFSNCGIRLYEPKKPTYPMTFGSVFHFRPRSRHFGLQVSILLVCGEFMPVK